MPSHRGNRSDLSHLISKPPIPALQTEGMVIHTATAKLAPGLTIGDLIELRSAGPCFLVSVSEHGIATVRKQSGGNPFTLRCTELRNQFLCILDYCQEITSSLD